MKNVSSFQSSQLNASQLRMGRDLLMSDSFLVQNLNFENNSNYENPSGSIQAVAAFHEIGNLKWSED